jgi:hypothetical protein
MKTSHLLSGVVIAVFGITTAVAAAQEPAAQADKQKSTEKAQTVTGCLAKGADANTFTLTDVEGTGPKTVQLHAKADQKLAPHVGHKVSITGSEIDPTTLKRGTTGKPEPGAEPKPSTEPKAGGSAERHLQVNSFKMISSTCPQ